MSIGGFAAGTAVVAGFGAALMGTGALMRNRHPKPDADPMGGLKVAVPVAIGGLGLAMGMASIGNVGDVGLAVFAISGLVGGVSALASGALLGQLLLDDEPG